VGAHIGSSKQCWITLTTRFVSGFRKGITLINVSYTTFHLRRALLFVQKIISKNGIIIINTLYTNTHIYLINRFYNMGQIVAPGDWIGGYLSNYRNLKKKIICKKKSRAFVSALVNLNYNIDNRFISSEANNSRLPIISIFDTNSQCAIFDFPIPTNNKNSSIRTFYAFLFSSAVFSGLVKKVFNKKKRSLNEIIRKVTGNTKFTGLKKNNFIFENSSYFSKDKNIYSKKYDYLFFNKFETFNYTEVNSALKVFYANKDIIFRLFKKRFLFNDFITNFDIIGIIVDKSIEDLMYEIRSIKFIKKNRNKFTSKIRFVFKRRRILLVFSKIRRIEVVASIKYKKFSRISKKIKDILLGSIFKSKDVIRSNLYIREINTKFFTNFNKKSFPWRIEYLKYKKFTIHFYNVIKKYKYILLKKTYYFYRNGSKKIIYYKNISKEFKKKRKINYVKKKRNNYMSGGGIEPPR
jgi:ribosomal protein S2